MGPFTILIKTVMKKRYLAIVALLVALGAGKADAAQYTVSDYSDSGPGTLRAAITGANGTNSADGITFSQPGTIILSPLPLINKGNVTFKTDYPVSLQNLSAAGSYVLGIGSTNPHVVIPANLSLVASGADHVTALYGVDQVNIDGTLGGNISATATNNGFVYGVQALNSLTIANNLAGEISATTIGGVAYGLFAENDLTIGGNITAGASVSAAAGGDHAFALFSGTGNISIGDTLNGTGNLAGVVSATATGSDAYGLLAQTGSIAIGNNLSGDISATARNGNVAVGMAVNTDLIIGGDITNGCSVIATAGGNDAGAIFSYLGNITIGDTLNGTGNLAGVVSATATGSYAYGLWAQTGSIAIGNNLSGDISATATNGSNAHAMRAKNDLTIGGDMTTGGSVSATAGGDNATALYSGKGNITIGDTLNGTGSLAGTVSATATGSIVYGLQADLGSIAIGNNLSGGISATANNGSDAYGMYARNDLTIGGNVVDGGSVRATAGTSFACGMIAYSGNLAITGNFSGDVSATATSGSNAVGMYAGTNLTIGGNLTAVGAIRAVAGGRDAYGIIANSGNLAITGGILAGEVSAEAGETWAAGLYAGGGIYGADSATPLTVSGTVTATANGAAAAILAVGAMNLDITGTVSGTDTGGTLLGYAIHSGDFDYIGTAGFVASAAVADQITVRSTGTLAGSVDLGAGDDSMTIKGLADISGVPTLSGGDGGGDDLVFQGWSGTLGEKVIDWESIQLTGNSAVDLGVDKEITPSAGSSLHMTIGSNAVVYAKGSSPGTYRIGGRLINNGTLDMLDNQVNDRVTVTGNYNGTGTLRLDADLGASGIQNPAEQLIINGNAANSSGPTTVIINNVENSVALTEGNGIRIIKVDGTSSDNAFVLGNPDDFGPFAVDLVNNDGSGWDVVSPGYREEAALLQGVTPFIERLGYSSVPRFHERRAFMAFSGNTAESRGFWVRTFGSKYRLGMSGNAATDVSGYSGGTQIGSDLSAGGSEKMQYNIGLYGGIGYQNGDVAGLRSVKAGELNDTAYSFGYYATLYAPEKYYIEGVLQASYHTFTVDYLTEPKQDLHLWSYLASLETGFSLPLSNSFILQPQVQMIYQHTDGLGLFTRVGEANIIDHDGLQGRLGFTGTVNSSRHNFNPFFEVNLIKDFSDMNQVSYLGDTVTLKSKPETLFLGGAVGISRKVSENNLGYYLKAEAIHGINGLDSYDYKLTAGIRKTW